MSPLLAVGIWLGTVICLLAVIVPVVRIQAKKDYRRYLKHRQVRR